MVTMKSITPPSGLFADWEEAPTTLYYEGDISLLTSLGIAVIGTRKPTECGIKTAFSLARHFATQGITIVSGLALGVDSWGHRGALAAGGKTIAVMGTAIDEIYPKQNNELAQEIVRRGGLLLSSYEYTTYDKQAFRQRLRERNHLLAALSQMIIIVQAKSDSGSRHAGNWAIKHNRPIAVPRPLENDRIRYAYIHELIRSNQAQIIESKQDYPKIIEQIKGEK